MLFSVSPGCARQLARSRSRRSASPRRRICAHVAIFVFHGAPRLQQAPAGLARVVWALSFKALSDLPRRDDRAVRPRLERGETYRLKMDYAGGDDRGPPVGLRATRAPAAARRSRALRDRDRRLEELDLRLLEDLGRRRHQCGRRRREDPGFVFQDASLQHGAQVWRLARARVALAAEFDQQPAACGSAGSGGGFRMPKRAPGTSPICVGSGDPPGAARRAGRGRRAVDDELRARGRRRRVERIVHEEGLRGAAKSGVPARDSITGHGA